MEVVQTTRRAGREAERTDRAFLLDGSGPRRRARAGSLGSSSSGVQSRCRLRGPHSKGCKRAGLWWGLLGFSCSPFPYGVTILPMGPLLAPSWVREWGDEGKMLSALFYVVILSFWALQDFCCSFIVAQSFLRAIFVGLWLFIYCFFNCYCQGNEHEGLLTGHLADISLQNTIFNGILFHHLVIAVFRQIINKIGAVLNGTEL